MNNEWIFLFFICVDVFAVVASEERGWKIAIYCDENVPLFGPSLPCPPVFEDPNAFREFLLVKLINGEKATFDTPTFSRKRERTLDSLLRDLYQEHTQDSKGNVSSVRKIKKIIIIFKPPQYVNFNLRKINYKLSQSNNN